MRRADRPGPGILVLLSLLAVTACGDSTTGSTALEGVFAFGTKSGTVSITIADATANLSVMSGPNYGATAAPNPVSATGSFTVQGVAPVSLSGTYDAGGHALSLSGGEFALNGLYMGGALEGGVTSNNSGSGSFTTQTVTSSTVLDRFCAAFTNTQNRRAFNLAVNHTSGLVTGVVMGSDGIVRTAGGSVSGGTVTMSFNAAEGPGSATGTINGTSISGTYTVQGGSTGAWSGSTC